MTLTPLAVSSAPLLTAIARNGDLSPKALAEASGRKPNNIARDLGVLADAGWIAREAGGPPQLTETGREILAALARANRDDHALAEPQAAAIPLPLELIDPDPELNPRTHFDADELEGLAASIADKGVLQPILVRRSSEPGRYRVVAGERRRRAAVIAGLFAIPVVICDLSDAEAFEVATIENVQRSDMNAVEEARAFDRIIAQRQAADPELKLKEAKELVAERVRKTVRFVELRLQLLTLPAAKQDEVAKGATSPKEAIKWLRDQPKPLSIPPEHWLVALEVYDRTLRFPLPKRREHESEATEVGRAAVDDPAAQALTYPSQLLAYVHELEDEDGYGLGRWALRPGWQALTQLRLRFGDITDEAICQKALAGIRAEAGVEFPLAYGPGEYVTPWLIGPFEPDAARLAEVAAERAEHERREAEQAQRKTQEEAERQAQAEAGRLLLAQAEDLIDEHRALGPEPFIGPIFAQLIEGTGRPLPWFPTDRAGIFDAQGEAVLHDWDGFREVPPATLARVRLIALAVNAAAGLATPATPPVKAQPAEPDEDGDGGDGEGDDEDDDDVELAPGEDEESPAFLRRLAGAAPAEAGR